MKKISNETSLIELAAIVSKNLKKNGIDAVLTGGSAVTVHSKNLYQSGDLDFIAKENHDQITRSLSELGFIRDGKHYTHPKTEFIVEFPGTIIQIGSLTVHEWSKKQTKFGIILILKPTHCVMDRLCGFYFWNDRQSLHQALLVARKNKIDLNEIKHWSQKEGELEKFNEFKAKLMQKI